MGRHALSIKDLYNMYDKQMTIRKTGLSRQVWSDGGSTLKKQGHKTAKVPSQQKLIHKI